MLEVIKIAEVKDKVRPVPLEETPQLKHVAIRLQHNSYNVCFAQLSYNYLN